MDHARVEYAASPEEAIDRVVARAADGDVILTLGAGNVSQLASRVLEELKSVASARKC